MQPQQIQQPKTPESIIGSVKEKLQGLALEIADNESRLDVLRTQVLEVERTRTAMILEYQKTLHAVIAMSELHKFNVESAKAAQDDAKKVIEASAAPLLPISSVESKPMSDEEIASKGTDILAQMPSQINGKGSKTQK